MSAVYDKYGVRFLYPENWTITDEQMDQWPRSVSIQSPGSAFWSLHVYPPVFDPARIAEEALLAMKQEYVDLESAGVTERIGPAEAIGYNLDFCCLDFVVTSQVRSFCTGGQTYLLICQAEDREFGQLSPVFRAMAISLIEGRGGREDGAPSESAVCGASWRQSGRGGDRL